jgi:hypothetical protein
MAVRHGYGKIAGTDALVFAYDTGDTINSYKGEPTVNLASNANFSNGTTGWNANQNVTLSVETINNIRFLKVKSNQTTSTPGFKSGNIAVSGNTTYTLTIRAYKNDNRSIWLYATGNGTGGSDIVWTPAPNGPNPITTELTTISRTFTTPSDMTYLQIGALWSAPLTTSEVYVEYMQLEQKSHATPFINGTRSATQGLLDLTGKSTIDLTNVSFDSNALPDWDGTSDYIKSTTPSDFRMGTNSFTLEAVAKQDVNTGHVLLEARGNNLIGYLWVVNHGTTGRMSLFYNDDSNQNIHYQTGDFNVSSTGVYYHLAVKVDKSENNIYFYINGEQAGNAVALQHTNSISPSSSDYYHVGWDRGGSPWNGQIAMFKHYNRALTAAEVANNYNHYKTRFNL